MVVISSNKKVALVDNMTLFVIFPVHIVALLYHHLYCCRCYCYTDVAAAAASATATVLTILFYGLIIIMIQSIS